MVEAHVQYVEGKGSMSIWYRSTGDQWEGQVLYFASMNENVTPK